MTRQTYRREYPWTMDLWMQDKEYIAEVLSEIFSRHKNITKITLEVGEPVIIDCIDVDEMITELPTPYITDQIRGR